MLIGNSRYWVKAIRKREFEITNKGAIQAHLQGDFHYPWKRLIVEYYVTAQMYSEVLDRTLVFTESEFKKLFPLYRE